MWYTTYLDWYLTFEFDFVKVLHDGTLGYI